MRVPPTAPPPTGETGSGGGSTILYTVGLSIPRSDCKDLEILLDQFHANEELQAMCRSVATNAECYITLENVNGLGQTERYKATILIPTGTLLAVYSGSLERVQPCEEDSLNHIMALCKVDFQYGLLVNGTTRPGDTRPGRLQLVNHCCEPGNTAVCEEWSCDVTGLIAYFLCSKQDILPKQEVTFAYQTPTFKKGVQVYPSRHFWKQAASLPSCEEGTALGAVQLCRGTRALPKWLLTTQADSGTSTTPSTFIPTTSTTSTPTHSTPAFHIAAIPKFPNPNCTANPAISATPVTLTTPTTLTPAIATTTAATIS
jgi:hypothetical protein